MRSAYVRIKIDTYQEFIILVPCMLNESQQKPKPTRQHIVPRRKRQDETSDVQIEIEKGKEKRKEKKRKVDITYARKKTARRGNNIPKVPQVPGTYCCSTYGCWVLVPQKNLLAHAYKYNNICGISKPVCTTDCVQDHLVDWGTCTQYRSGKLFRIRRCPQLTGRRRDQARCRRSPAMQI